MTNIENVILRLATTAAERREARFALKLAEHLSSEGDKDTIRAVASMALSDTDQAQAFNIAKQIDNDVIRRHIMRSVLTALAKAGMVRLTLEAINVLGQKFEAPEAEAIIENSPGTRMGSVLAELRSLLRETDQTHNARLLSAACAKLGRPWQAYDISQIAELTADNEENKQLFEAIVAAFLAICDAGGATLAAKKLGRKLSVNEMETGLANGIKLGSFTASDSIAKCFGRCLSNDERSQIAAFAVANGNFLEGLEAIKSMDNASMRSAAAETAVAACLTLEKYADALEAIGFVDNGEKKVAALEQILAWALKNHHLETIKTIATLLGRAITATEWEIAIAAAIEARIPPSKAKLFADFCQRQLTRIEATRLLRFAFAQGTPEKIIECLHLLDPETLAHLNLDAITAPSEA